MKVGRLLAAVGDTLPSAGGQRAEPVRMVLSIERTSTPVTRVMRKVRFRGTNASLRPSRVIAQERSVPSWTVVRPAHLEGLIPHAEPFYQHPSRGQRPTSPLVRWRMPGICRHP